MRAGDAIVVAGRVLCVQATSETKVKVNGAWIARRIVRLATEAERSASIAAHASQAQRVERRIARDVRRVVRDVERICARRDER